MPSTGVDRITGNTTSVAVKSPVRICVNNTASPTVLSGIQTLQGVLLSAGGASSTGNASPDRVLVNDQDLTVGGQPTNGIYLVQTGAWIPAYDCNGPRDLALGSLVPVEGGTFAGTLWQCTSTDNPIDIGLSNITFAQNPFLPTKATSVTSNTIATGSLTFQTQSGLPLGVGQFVLIASTANAANYVHGQVTAYSGTTLTVNVLDTGGAGTITSWNIFPSSPQGPAPGAGSIANSQLANMAANTVKMNATGAPAAPQDVAVPALNVLGGSGPIPYNVLANYITAPAFTNKFRNPIMDTAQRGTSGTITAGSPAYTLDGWIVSATGANMTWSQGQGLGPIGNTFVTSNKLILTGLTSNSDVSLSQRIESIIAATLVSQQVTVQFMVFNGTGVSLTPQLSTGYASSVDNFTTVTPDLAATNMQAIGSGQTAVISYTFPCSANAANGYQVKLDFGAINANTKSVHISAADIRPTPGVATGLNSTPPYPEQRPISLDLPFNQRYFNQSYGNGVAPATATKVGIITAISGAGYLTFPSQMRAAPASISFWDGAGNGSKVSQNTGLNTWTDNISPAGSPAAFNTSGLTGTNFGLYNSTSAIIGFQYSASAEL